MTYAIFATGGRQFKAEPGVTIKVPLLAAEPGSKVTFDQVLLASDGKHVHTGKPVLKGAKVTAEVVRHAKGEKIRIYRFARRASDDTLFTVIDGQVKFEHKNKKRYRVSVYPTAT